VAIVDHLQQSHCKNKVGFFGFFESIDEQAVVDALLSEAQAWLRERGCDQMRGPVDPSMKGEFGVVVDGNDAPPMIMMAHNMARYRDQLIAAGLEQVREFYSFQFLSENEPVDQWQRLFESRDKIIKRFPQLSFKEVTQATFSQTMRDVNELGNRVRSEGWGFVPLTESELDFMIKNLRRVIRYDMIHVAYWEDKLVGYIVNIPDVNWALQRAKGPFDWVRMLQMPMLLKRCPRTRVIALGVDKDYRTKGIAMLLIARLVERFQEFKEWEFSWVDSENQKSIRAIARTLPLVRSKTYQLFERKI
jgi:GNAT superfamily N-acetyltransferase